MPALAPIRATVLGIALGAVAVAAACVRSAPDPNGAPAAAPRPPQRQSARDNRNVISLDEISASTEAQNAYDLVRRLRPAFLVDRGPPSFRTSVPRTAQVYVDNVRMGGIEALRDIPRDGVAEIRYYSGPDATTRWGTGHSSGVIYVAMRH
ncbi:MAG TPA: hypothetical protein VKA84_06820 [Gemmatimonadaceae bacterium]|nr:hypothetical protein [Gemmatimonadaceae bacterium]